MSLHVKSVSMSEMIPQGKQLHAVSAGNITSRTQESRMISFDFEILSWNVKGLRDGKKRRKVFSRIKHHTDSNALVSCVFSKKPTV